mgnify:CR=1 FL=1
MNERIKQLAFKAFQPINDVTSEGVADRRTFNQLWFEHYNQNFAELIVAEAIAVLQKRFMGDLNREDMEVRRCIEDVKKHFGVEE